MDSLSSLNGLGKWKWLFILMEDMALDTVEDSDHDDELLLLLWLLLVVSVVELLLFDGNLKEVDDIQSVAESTVCHALFIHDEEDDDWSIAAAAAAEVSEFNWGLLSADLDFVWNVFNQEDDDAAADEEDDADAAANVDVATWFEFVSSLSLSLSSWKSGIESDPKYWEPAALASRWYFIRSSRSRGFLSHGDGGVLLLLLCSFLRDIK